MDWSKLISQFLTGDTDAIQAVFTMFGFLVGIAGTYFVAKSFRQQTKINSQQYELNRIAGEKHRRAIRPNFQVKSWFEANDLKGFELKLTNAIALNIALYKYDESSNIQATPFKNHNAWEPMDASSFYTIDPAQIETMQDILVKIQFSDEDGVRYCQLVKRRGQEIYATFPKILTNGM